MPVRHPDSRLCRVNLCLDELYLLGNPCAEFEGYRLFVIGTLPQLKKLDGNKVTATERILAGQQLQELRERLVIAAKEIVRVRGGNPDLVGFKEEEEEQIVDSDDERELYGWSAEIRVADYKKEVKREQKQAAEQKLRDMERDPMKFAEEEARANRELFKAGACLCSGFRVRLTRAEGDGQGPVKSAGESERVFFTVNVSCLLASSIFAQSLGIRHAISKYWIRSVTAHSSANLLDAFYNYVYIFP